MTSRPAEECCCCYLLQHDEAQELSVADMIPAMALVMPISAFWTGVIAPML